MKNPRIIFAAILLTTAFSACSAPPQIKAVRVVRTNVESTVSSVNSGSVHAEQVAELAFGTVGRVSKLNVKVGDIVKAGTILAELENEDLTAARETALAEQKRRTELFQHGLMAQALLDESRRIVDSADSAYEKSLIRAPYDGIIGELNLEVGQLSQITAIVPKAMIRIIDLKPRYISAEIDEADLSKIKPGLKARVKILAMRREPFSATVRKVVAFVNSVREQDRTAEIELDVDSGPELLPAGASADVEIIVDSHPDALAVPSRFVFGRGGNRYVFELDGSTVKKHSVDVGIYNYDKTELLGGITAGTVVAQPSDTVDLIDGMKVAADIQPWP